MTMLLAFVSELKNVQVLSNFLYRLEQIPSIHGLDVSVSTLSLLSG